MNIQFVRPTLWMFFAMPVIGLCMLGSARAQAEATQRPPNILFIMIDDLGWTDLHCQGNALLETPNIDRLATQGMRFTDAYAAAPVCSPTRAAIMTGLSPARLAITNHIPDQKRFQPDNATLRSAETVNFLALDYVTIAEHLKRAGYATAFIGKWHLSGTRSEMKTAEPKRRPEYQGFDRNVGGCCYGGPPSYFEPYRIPSIKPKQEGAYLTDRLADETIDFMRGHQDRPFFIALWNYTVHWPMQAPQPLIDKYSSRTGLKDTRYAAMIEAMDGAIGRILKALDELELAEETLVVFTSDNGAFGGVTDLTPLRAAKGYLYEGGIRVPLIVRWPGHIEPGSICRTPVISMDFYPTLLEVAGIQRQPHEPLDGESLLPLFKQTGPLRRTAIYFHYPNYAFHRSNRLGGAIRIGDYKLIERYEDGSVELYHLSKDIGEQEDLSKQKPDLAREMKAQLDRWLRETGAKMPKPVISSQ
ncbi:MAG: sulfatase [Planctomycetes bacterium]|nr:sulfatase [Planctomycetota bacterium]